MAQTTSNGREQRKSLANEIDRLDGILDGLDEALAGAVETAVRDVVGQAVRDAVEATVREVLSNPDLIRSALAHHAPVATPAPAPGRTLKEILKDKLAALSQMASEMASRAKRGLRGGWAWCVEKLKRGLSLLRACAKVSLSLAHIALCAAWKYRKTTLVALTAGLLVGIGAYFAGPAIASSVCGIAGALATAAGIAMRQVWKAISGTSSA